MSLTGILATLAFFVIAVLAVLAVVDILFAPAAKNTSLTLGERVAQRRAGTRLTRAFHRVTFGLFRRAPVNTRRAPGHRPD